MMLNIITAWLYGYVMRFSNFYSVVYYLLVPWTHLSAAGQTRINKNKNNRIANSSFKND